LTHVKNIVLYIYILLQPFVPEAEVIEKTRDYKLVEWVLKVAEELEDEGYIAVANSNQYHESKAELVDSVKLLLVHPHVRQTMQEYYLITDDRLILIRHELSQVVPRVSFFQLYSWDHQAHMLVPVFIVSYKEVFFCDIVDEWNMHQKLDEQTAPRKEDELPVLP